MKLIGLLGGMSWESTQTYYRLLNEEVRGQLGGLHSARILLYSVDFAEIEGLQQQGDWARAAGILSEAARSLVTPEDTPVRILDTTELHVDLAVRYALGRLADQSPRT